MVERPRPTTLPGTVGVQGHIETIATGTANEVLVWRNNTGAKVKITKAAFTPDEAVTGAATNNFSLQFKSKLAAGGANKNITAVRTYASGTDIAQFAEDSLVLSTTAADLEVDDGEAVTLDKAINGSGLVLPAGIATLEFQFIA